MSQAVLTLDLPDEILARLRRTARGMNQPLEEALVKIVEAATPSLDKVPLEYRAELEAMEDLSDEDLWQIAKSRLGPARERRLAKLLHKIQHEDVTDGEAQALTELHSRPTG